MPRLIIIAANFLDARGVTNCLPRARVMRTLLPDSKISCSSPRYLQHVSPLFEHTLFPHLLFPSPPQRAVVLFRAQKAGKCGKERLKRDRPTFAATRGKARLQVRPRNSCHHHHHHHHHPSPPAQSHAYFSARQARLRGRREERAERARGSRRPKFRTAGRRAGGDGAVQEAAG